MKKTKIHNYFTLSAEQKDFVIERTVRKLKTSLAVIEKDLWVCILLKYLFNDFKYKDYLVFKGGTSLSKVYNLIERFSEDIDLALNWEVLGYPQKEPYEARSYTKQEKYLDKLNENTSEFLKNEVIPAIESDLNSLLKNTNLKFYIDAKNPQSILFDYPKEYDLDPSILSVIKLEIGAVAEPIPFEEKEISTYISQANPQSFLEKISVRVVDPIRTFYEKIAILHKEANRTNGNYPNRYSRHYYDVYKMLQSNLKERSFQNLEILESVIEFLKKFYRANFAKYDDIYQAKLKLIPSAEAIEFFKNDYNQTKSMIFGEQVSFDEILKTLQAYESELNLIIKSFDKWSNKTI
ncbi:nucleotidyl transferase AbiEii/AbiGii toxin family protein [Mycoplasmopsis citelli]|uniref:nucleotidyl transferase AbiEii/AbiGii toxin family protein n=1 Tax=Mycoplasmopsis citelli TaxID=171281 RepID=UPI0021146804|nr:nucleotidyl transferase AbiEii/AbiGii toxin family protein [Mycoplasmopsis citelli]UUD36022.1 nucleotidyl transferase AbiEii/AbiGii toxin family protein [Mycoplasmopsis citelli]